MHLLTVWEMMRDLTFEKGTFGVRLGQEGPAANALFFFDPYAHVCDVYRLRGCNHPLSSRKVRPRLVAEL